MRKKLLNKNLQLYAIYSILILLISCFAFYFFLKKIYVGETHEALVLKSKMFESTYQNKLKINEIATWNKYNTNQKIVVLKSKHKTFKEIEVFDIIEKEKIPFLEYQHPILIENKLFTLQTKDSLFEKEDIIKSILMLFVFLLVFLILGLCILTQIISVKIWRPFYQTLNSIKSFEIDKMTKFEYSESKIEEFQNLNQAFENLINTNLGIYQNQREFVENAAHELQTPLAIFQNQLAMLIQNKDLTVEQAGIIQKINLTVARLNRLNKNLLFLSKLEKTDFEKQEVNLSKMLQEYTFLFAEQFDSHQLIIQINLKENVILRTNQQLLESVLFNVLSNAVKHNYINGKIEIILTNTYVKVINTSLNQELIKENLYVRFQKINPSSEGNGLGLSILKKIVEINNWEIVYEYENNLHAFQLNF